MDDSPVIPPAEADDKFRTLSPAVLALKLKAWVAMQFAKAVIMTSGAFRSCPHTDEKGYTIVRGNLIHCKCGQSFNVKCLHIRIERVLPKVFRCVDCREWRGAGEVDYDAENGLKDL